MMSYEVFAVEEFEKRYKKVTIAEQSWIDVMKTHLESEPTGKILHYSWFREKKYLNKRLFFIVDEPTKRVLLVAYGSKKEQQRYIDFVKEHKEELFFYLRSL